MNPVFLVLIGFGLGIAVWFPYRHVLNRLVKKKRETTSILKELSMTEKEHLQYMDPSRDWGYKHNPSTTANTWVGDNYTKTSYDQLSKAYADMMQKWTTATQAHQATQAVLSQTYQVRPGTFSPSGVVSTTTGAQYCTHCNGLVGSESHSCERGTDAR